MTTDDWQAIEAAFEKALSFNADEREAFVSEFEREHPGLGKQLEKLLEADDKGETGLRARVGEVAQHVTREAADPWIGRTVGAWTITSRLAGGGMGAVFLAERSDKQYMQVAAVKVMAAQLLHPEAISRFKSERQILANLSHPYIARLIDGGSTDDGLPFLVMEYVKGEPIDDYCDQHKLSVEERLALFRKVCDATDYAHRRLIVHRDLKPSNILVDANGDPKLLDFGIAKLLEAGSYNNTIAVTREGSRAMTPEYASPEQVRGEPVSVATDVYAMGVLLFRLMTGQSPYGTTVSTPLEYEKAIIEYDPRKPSTVVTDQDAGLAAGNDIGAMRDTSSKRLRRMLVGDLDNIVLKALQKEPERRYPTASALAADIKRFLANEPVEARGDAWAYRAMKFVARNARPLAVTAVVLFAIASIIAFYTMQLADERDRANLAAAEANEVSSFLTELFQSASPHESKGEEITAVDLLAQGRERIEELGEQPILQAELYRIMGSSYTALGHLNESIPILESALAMKEAERPRNEHSIADALHDLGEAYRQRGDTELAEEYLRRALEIRESILGSNDEGVIYTKARLGVVLFDARKTDEALELLQEALAAKIATGDGEDSQAIDMRGNIANSLDNLGRYDEAEALHRENIELSKRVDGELHPNTVIRMGNLGLVLTRQGRYQEAVDQFTEALRRGEQVWPPNHDQLAFMTGARGANLKRLGQFEASLENYQTAASMTRANLGEENVRYVARLRGVGSILMDMRRFDEADATFGRALELAVTHQGADGYHATLLRSFLGQSKIDQGEFAEAEAFLARAKPHLDQLGSYAGLIAQRELGDALSAQGKFAEAEPLLLDALKAREQTSGLDSPTLIGFLAALSRHYRRAGDLEQALDLGRRAHELAGPEAQNGVWSAAEAIAIYARALDADGQMDEAQRIFREAHAALAAILGPDDARTLSLLPNL